MGIYQALCKTALLLLLVPIFLQGQDATSLYHFGIPQIQNYYPMDYQAHSQVWAIDQGPHGRMLFGNGNGLIIYDGTNWDVITSSSKGMIRRVGVDISGNIYCSGAGDFGVVERSAKGSFEFRSLASHLQEGSSIPYFRGQVIQSGQVYFFSSSRIICWNSEREEMQELTSEDNFMHIFSMDNKVFSSLKDRPEIMLISGSEREIEEVPIELLAGERLRQVQEKNGYDLFWTSNRIIIKIEDIELDISKNISELFQNRYINSVEIFNENKVAVGSDDGLIILDLEGNILLWLREDDGLTSRRIHFLKEDLEGNLWVSTDKGISKIKFNVPFRYFDFRKGMPGIINDILIRDDMIVVSGHEGVYFNSGTDQFKPLLDPNIEAFKILDMEDHFLISSTFGVFEFDLKSGSYRKILPFHAYKIFPSRVFKNRIYVCSTKGLIAFTWKERRVQDQTDLSSFVPDFVRFIEEDDEGNLWLGSTLNPLYFLEMNGGEYRVTKFTEEDGLPTSEIKINRIFDKYLFSSLNGVFRFENSRFSRHPDFQNDTLMVPFILESRTNQMAYLLYGNTPFMSLRAFGFDGESFKGLSFPELGTFVSSGLWMGEESKEGVIWLGTTDGLIAFDQNQSSRSFQPELFLSGIQGGDSVLMRNWSSSWGDVWDKPVKIFPKKNFLKLEFSVPSYTDELRNEYRYKLEGLDPEWSDWTTSSGKEYSGLIEGDYIFNAQARSPMGVETEVLSIPFIVFPPWYRSVWFLISISIVVIISITIITRYYSQAALKRRVRELELQEKIRIERERISTNLHDHVGAQLTSIISGIQVTEKLKSIREDKGAVKLLESLKDDAKESISNLRDTIWTLNKGSINVGDFVDEVRSDLGKLIQYSDLDLKIKNGVPSSVEMNPNMAFNLKQVLKESIQNVLKHAEAKSILITIDPETKGPTGFSIVVKDDGKGFDPESMKSNVGHFGLKNIENRVSKTGGKLVIDSSPGQGTMIKISF